MKNFIESDLYKYKIKARMRKFNSTPYIMERWQPLSGLQVDALASLAHFVAHTTNQLWMQMHFVGGRQTPRNITLALKRSSLKMDLCINVHMCVYSKDVLIAHVCLHGYLLHSLGILNFVRTFKNSA